MDMGLRHLLAERHIQTAVADGGRAIRLVATSALLKRGSAL